MNLKWRTLFSGARIMKRFSVVPPRMAHLAVNTLRHPPQRCTLNGLLYPLCKHTGQLWRHCPRSYEPRLRIVKDEIEKELNITKCVQSAQTFLTTIDKIFPLSPTTSLLYGVGISIKRSWFNSTWATHWTKTDISNIIISIYSIISDEGLGLQSTNFSA